MHARTFRFTAALLLLGCATILLAAPALSRLYYDLDFGTPPHTVGMPPVIGGGPPPRNTVSAIPFGTPTVIDELGALDDQPLFFESYVGGGDQIQLRLDDLPPSDFYGLQCELFFYSIERDTEFTLFLDTPQVRRINFNGDETVSIWVPGSPTTPIGTYVIDEIVVLRVDLDLAADTWEIYLDSVLAHSGSFGGATRLTGVRFSTRVTPEPPGASVALDNLLIGDAVVIPDIEIVSFTAPSVAGPGVPIGSQIGLTIRNAGGVDITDPFQVGFYISPDPIITTGDDLLIGGREGVPGLAAGEVRDVPLFSGARIPAGYPLGDAYLGVIVDEFEDITESDETNNTAWSRVRVVESTSIAEADAPGHHLWLERPAPNPFSDRTVMSYHLPFSGNTRLVVFDAEGREVVRVIDGFQPAGHYASAWDGRGGAGRRLGAGTYFARLYFDGR
jgi:hypothetical protein